MTVTINKTDGTVLTTIADGAADTTATNLVLIGRLYKNYGELINENMVKLLENFASASSPSAPIVGQVWYDKGTNNLKVYRSTGFVSLSRITSSNAEPSTPSTADFWWDSNDEQLRIYNGSSWTTLSPGYTASQTKSGVFVETIQDVTYNDHICVVVYQQNQRISIFCKDDEFTPLVAISGFSTIKKGLNLSSISGFLLQGTATNAQLLDSLDSTQFLRSDENDATTGSLSIQNDDGLIIGDDGDIEITVVGTDAIITKTTSGNLKIVSETDIALLINNNEQVMYRDGLVSSPTISWQDDNDTGLYRIGSGNMGMASNGVLVANVGPSGSTFATNVNVNGNLGVAANLTVTSRITAGSYGPMLVAGTLGVTGNVSLGDAAGDGVTFNAGLIDAPNDLSIVSGNLTVGTGNFEVGGTATFNDDVDIIANVTITGDTALNGTTVANGVFSVTVTDANDFKVDASARVLVNTTTPAAGFTLEGDVTVGDDTTTNAIFARNTPKYVCTFNGTLAGLAIYSSQHVATLTRTTTGTYAFTLTTPSLASLPLANSYPTIAGVVNGSGVLTQNGTSTASDTSILINTYNTSGALTDYTRCGFAIWDGGNR